MKANHYKGTPTDNPRPTIDSLRVVWLCDESADVSWLNDEGRYSDCTPEDAARYRAADTARLETFGMTWHMTGCTAEATVSYPVSDRGDRRMEHFTSGGLWGIESDADQEYRTEVETDELTDLLDHLDTFGVDVSDFWTNAPANAQREMRKRHDLRRPLFGIS